MPNDEFQKERPQIQKEPSLSDARSETRLPLADDNRYRRPDPLRNSMALKALCLGIVSLILSGVWLMAILSVRSSPEPSKPGDFRSLISTGILGMVPVQLVLGLTTLASGILGLKSHYKHPNLGGFGNSMFGTVMGILTVLFYLWPCLGFLLLFSGAGAGGGWK
jgi:hypothetical protein